MKKNEKRMILILLVVLVIAVVVFAVNKNKKDDIGTENSVSENNTVEEFVQILEDGTKLNTSTELGKTKQVGSFKFENIQLTEQNGQTVLLANVTNTGSSATESTIVEVSLLDKNGENIVTINGIIKDLQPGETTQFNTSMTLDYANAYDFKIVIK